MTNARAIHDPKLYQPRHQPSARAFPRTAPALFGWLWGLGLLLCCPVVHADAAARHYAIPPQSLNDALMIFALQSDLKLVVPADLIRGLPSQELTGDHTPEQGLQYLLAGSGMRYRLEGSTLTIERAVPLSELVNQAKQPLRVSQATPEKPKQQTQPKPKADATTELPEMTVTAKPTDETSYNPPNATTATKTDTPIMDTPVSIQVVPQQALRDQQAIRSSDALKNVSGVQPSFGFTQREVFTLRGFDTGAGQYRDGFRAQESIFSLANAERVEVLKGPASVLFGRIEPGGLINIVTKRPLASPYYALEQQFGSFDTYRTTLDATGPITQDSTLAYRLNFEYLDQDSFRDFGSTNRKFVAPSLTWHLSERTQIDLDFMYQDEDGIIDDGIPGHRGSPGTDPHRTELFEGTRFARPIPINIFNPVYGTVPEFRGEPPNVFFKQDDSWWGVYVQDQIQLGDRWHALLGFRYDDAEAIRICCPPPGEPVDAPTIKAQEFSPRFGLLYHPLLWLALYGSYAEGFGGVNEGVTADGSPPGPNCPNNTKPV